MTTPFATSLPALPDGPSVSPCIPSNHWSIFQGSRTGSPKVSGKASGLHLVERGDAISAKELPSRLRGLYRPAQTSSVEAKTGGPRGPHPGDVVYWVTCLGAVGLLLFAAT